MLLPKTRSRLHVDSVLAGLVSASLLVGCGHEKKSSSTSVATPPAVHVTRPQMRTITRVVGQPSFVEAYERTSIYPKLTGYIEKWYVDIGVTV